MVELCKPAFDVAAFLASAGAGTQNCLIWSRKRRSFRRAIQRMLSFTFRKAGPISVVSAAGKEATIRWSRRRFCGRSGTSVIA